MRLNLLTNNIWLKIGALILAVSLWFYVAGEESIEESIKMLLQIELAPDMVVAEQKVNVLAVKIRGRKEVISKLDKEKLVAKVDLTSYKEPKAIIYSIDRKSLLSNPNIDILQVVPERFEVKIDKMMRKVMPIRIVTEGEPAHGFEIEGFVIDPMAVMVKGPEVFFKDLIYVDTEPVDVTGRQKSFKKMIPLKGIPMGGEKMPPQYVEVVVKIIEKAKIQKLKSKG